MKTHIPFPPSKNDRSGSIWQPALLWFLGAPTGIVLLLWFFFFRG